MADRLINSVAQGGTQDSRMCGCQPDIFGQVLSPSLIFWVLLTFQIFLIVQKVSLTIKPTFLMPERQILNANPYIFELILLLLERSSPLDDAILMMFPLTTATTLPRLAYLDFSL